MSRGKISSDFEVSKSLGALYTGGDVEWVDKLIFTLANGAVNIVQDGSVLATVEEEEDPVLTFTTIKKTRFTLITAHKSGLLRQWEVDELAKPELVKTFRSIHTGPISLLKLHELVSGGVILGTGGTDGTLKVWDLDAKYYTHNFRTGSGVCSCIEFHPSKLVAVTGFQSGGLFVFDLTNSKQLHSLEGHYSAVTAVKVLAESSELVSAGRDKVIIIWCAEKGVKKRTIPVGCSVEGLHVISPLKVVLAAEDTLVVWDLETPKKVQQVTLGSQISKMAAKGSSIYCSTADLNLVELDVTDLSLVNTVVGNNDEILDLTFVGTNSSHLIVACNSPFIRLYKVSDYSCSLVRGHSDTVMCVSVSSMDPNLLCSGGKDREIRVWRLEDGLLTCLLVGTGHNEAVQGLSFPAQSIHKLYSVSKDTTVKCWNIDYDKATMSSLRTEIGHDKEINCCDISPGDELLATGSQDKTCKLWDKELNLVSTLRGHKRGIWCVKFSHNDRILASGSADATIKVWNMSDYSCLKQLEGHDCSVLSLSWISDNQIVSSATDGLLKVWLVNKQECVATLDQHTDKVWSVVCRRDETGELELTAGSASGQLVTWVDVTEAAVLKKQEEQGKLVVEQQKLANLMASKQFGAALRLALRLSQPFTALKILKRLDHETMREPVLSLDRPALDQLLGYTVKWNTNSRHSEVAQTVLNIILTNHVPDNLLKLEGSRSWVEGLLPYTDKHFQRLSRLQMKSKFLSFLVTNMKATSVPLPENEL